MNVPDPRQEVKALLQRLGLSVPDGDLPFLQRTLTRQRELLAAMRATVPPETEPAHVFRPVEHRKPS